MDKPQNKYAELRRQAKKKKKGTSVGMIPLSPEKCKPVWNDRRRLVITWEWGGREQQVR